MILLLVLNTQRESTLQGESLLLGIETRVRQAFTSRFTIFRVTTINIYLMQVLLLIVMEFLV